jgi:hypothetical protein
MPDIRAVARTLSNAPIRIAGADLPSIDLTNT